MDTHADRYTKVLCNVLLCYLTSGLLDNSFNTALLSISIFSLAVCRFGIQHSDLPWLPESVRVSVQLIYFVQVIIVVYEGTGFQLVHDLSWVYVAVSCPSSRPRCVGFAVTVTHTVVVSALVLLVGQTNTALVSVSVGKSATALESVSVGKTNV
jgi:hypothetical protein